MRRAAVVVAVVLGALVAGVAVAQAPWGGNYGIVEHPAAATSATITTTGNATIGGDAAIAGNATIAGTLGVTGAVSTGAQTVTGAVAASGACTNTSDTACLGADGVVGGQRTSTTDPSGMMLRPQVCAPGDATCAAAALSLFGGQDTTTCAIDGADPSVSCAGDNDTITVTVIDSDGTSTATILTEGTQWTASASVATTCASLAAAVDALAGVGATCTSPDVLFTLDGTTGRVTLAESTAGCTTVATGTPGVIKLIGAVDGGGSAITFNDDWQSSSATGIFLEDAACTSTNPCVSNRTGFNSGYSVDTSGYSYFIFGSAATLTCNSTNCALAAAEGWVHPVNTITGVDTLTVVDCGKTTIVTAGIDGSTITLPEASTVLGCEFSISYTGADGGALVDISPLDSDADGIEGTCGATTFSGTADADIGLTKATGVTGNGIGLRAATSAMYVVTWCNGIWANN